ncbi:MAG: ABC-F family ATP-binding cassette domain-containing protein [Treponema sp.]|jgi:ATP-binding cassette subfamily F protein 3|nr:ABC-F family ATP-binding cassette domain-containing protein [Treponema sp.]
MNLPKQPDKSGKGGRVQCARVSLAFGDRDILKDVSLFLAPGSRAALAGVNGSGKTTLLKIIAKEIAADSGEVVAEKSCRIAYLPQAGSPVSGGSPPGEDAGSIAREDTPLWDEAESAYDDLAGLVRDMETIGGELEHAKDDAATAALLEQYHRLQETVEESGYYRRDAAISSTLKGLGFSEKDFHKKCGTFSGGWRMRAALAKTLLKNPDIILLDEPTNYLDIEARSWLESWLRTFRGGYLLVSHDRYFLDVTVNEVYELFRGSLKRYYGNYSAYEKLRRQELEALYKQYEAQREEIAKSEELIRRFRYKASKAAMVQERIKRLEKMERIEIPESLKKISFSFPPAPRSGRVVLRVSGLGKSYENRPVLSGLDLDVDLGERLLVVGRNGAGKSTLLRILAGADSAGEGTLQYGAGVVAGYFSQESAGLLQSAPDAGNQSVLSLVESRAPAALVPVVRDMLGAFLFRGDDVYKPVSVLSGGETSRLALLRLLLAPANLLILDEPTNHLDISSKDILLEALVKFGGTIIFVSHDRAFMETLSTKTLELRPPDDSRRPSTARFFFGNYTYYLERLERESSSPISPLSALSALSPISPPTDDRDVPAKPRGENTPGTSGGESQDTARRIAKQRQALVRRLEREEAGVLLSIEKLEAEKARLESELAKPEVYSSAEKSRELQAAINASAGSLEAQTLEWERIAAELEAARLR